MPDKETFCCYFIGFVLGRNDYFGSKTSKIGTIQHLCDNVLQSFEHFHPISGKIHFLVMLYESTYFFSQSNHIMNSFRFGIHSSLLLLHLDSTLCFTRTMSENLSLTMMKTHFSIKFGWLWLRQPSCLLEKLNLEICPLIQTAGYLIVFYCGLSS